MQSEYVSKDDIQVQPEFSQLKIIAEYDMWFTVWGLPI